MPKENEYYFTTYFTEAEEKQYFSTIKKFFAENNAQRDYYWNLLLRDTGIRLNVVANLTVGHAKDCIETERFTVLGEYNKRGVELRFHAKRRIIFSLDHLLSIHRKMSQGTNWRGWELERNDRPLVLSRNAYKGLSPRAYQKRVRFWCLAAGLDFSASPHWWRHTWAKRQIDPDNPNDLRKLRLIQAHLGHRKLDTTMMYLKPDKEEMREFTRNAI